MTEAKKRYIKSKLQRKLKTTNSRKLRKKINSKLRSLGQKKRKYQARIANQENSRTVEHGVYSTI